MLYEIKEGFTIDHSGINREYISNIVLDRVGISKSTYFDKLKHNKIELQEGMLIIVCFFVFQQEKS